MNKYLIKLADHLDKKGLHKEADYVDWIMKESADLEKDEFINLEKEKIKKPEFTGRLSSFEFSDPKMPIDLKKPKDIAIDNSKKIDEIAEVLRRELGVEFYFDKENKLFT